MLVATTVIEVGVDIPNATIMVIEDADRFGLAQLHKLRGRVGRGSEQSYCFLFESAEPTRTAATARGPGRARERLRAGRDRPAMRGEGALLGDAQSGLSDLRFARLHRDRTLLERAREDAGVMLLRRHRDTVLAAAAEAASARTIAGMRPGREDRRRRPAAPSAGGPARTAPARPPTVPGSRSSARSATSTARCASTCSPARAPSACEALSRGAAHATLVEVDRPPCRHRANAEALGVADRVRVVRRDARRVLRDEAARAGATISC